MIISKILKLSKKKVENKNKFLINNISKNYICGDANEKNLLKNTRNYKNKDNTF